MDNTSLEETGKSEDGLGAIYLLIGRASALGLCFLSYQCEHIEGNPDQGPYRIGIFEPGRGVAPWHSVVASGTTLDEAIEDAKTITIEMLLDMKAKNAEIAEALSIIAKNTTQGFGLQKLFEDTGKQL